ncbi:MAG TPA: hypothetical protein VGM89_14895, partial [Puia sp.]
MSRQVLIVIVLLWVSALLAPSSSAAQQRGVDTISHTSTCVNSIIVFASPLLDTFFRPDYIRWHFSDPASGYNDSSGADKPRHVFAATGAYPIELDVYYRGSDTIKIRDTITIVTPMAYSFGPDIYVCGKNPDTLIHGPVIPGATYTWNDADTTHTDTIRITKSGIFTVAVNGCGVTD